MRISADALRPFDRLGAGSAAAARLRNGRPQRGAFLVLLLLAALALAGCSTSSADEGTRSSSQTGFVSGKQLTIVSPAQRRAAPVVSGPELGTDKQISSADYPGKVLVINVWGSWCAPCRGEAEGLEQASRRTAKKAQFLGINNRDDDPANGMAFVRVHGITYPSIYDPSGTQLVKFARTLPPSSIPSTLVLDTKGRIAVRILGPIDANTLVDAVDDVAAGK